MHRYPDYTRQRINQLSNRIRDAIRTPRVPLDEMLVSAPVGRITYDEAQKLNEFRPAKIGEQFGPLWTTFWFRVKATVPADWKGKRVELLWDTRSESTLWIDGKAIQGLNMTESDRPDAILIDKAKGGEKLEFQLEMACNGLFGIRTNPTLTTISPFVLERAELAAFNQTLWDLYYDFKTLVDLETELHKEGGATDSTWAGELLYELNRFANEFELEDESTWKSAQAILKKLYTRKAPPQTHEVSAIGHAHIDTAWLWPLAETDRKCVRTFATATRYMDEYPEYIFSLSQAYQYWRMQSLNPDLYARMVAKVKNGQIVPVGGTWIEPDCNIPSGEALIRQFLYGQRFFEKQFGKRCKEFWNPDVFGYNGQLPQIMQQAGITRFLTQKLSWNKFNRPAHHTFTWQGIDGSEVLAHFPPTDTYNSKADVVELRKNMKDYKDHDRSRHSMMLFGYGDGGGGPTKTMLETLKRAKDLHGLPRTQMRTSDEFFELLENDITDRPLMIGELYFELHRGTYTSQAANKRDNRKTEFLLHEIEFLATLAALKKPNYQYPRAEIDRLWQIVLLNQFHDILPGSSIELVYEDSAKDYADVLRSGKALRDQAVAALFGGKGATVAINTLGFDRAEVATDPTGKPVFVTAAPYSVGTIGNSADSVKATESADGVVLENANLRATLNKAGGVVALFDKKSKREVLAAPADFALYDDHPTNWEAWDVDPYHLETEKPLAAAGSYKVVNASPLRADVVYERKIGKKSSMKQTIRLDAAAQRLEIHCVVDWQETRKMLKALVPVNVRAMNATYEMQFGVAERPTHFNTSYDIARYEVPGHKFADMSEHGFGVALLSESKYGYSTFGNVLRMSLLRATNYPDPKADRGEQKFSLAIMPHAGDWRSGGVVAEAHRFNLPLVFGQSDQPSTGSFASVDDANVVLDTIKRAEDSASTIVRLFECHGARGTAKLKIDVPFKAAIRCNAMEDEQGPMTVKDGVVEVPYLPFQVITIKLT